MCFCPQKRALVGLDRLLVDPEARGPGGRALRLLHGVAERRGLGGLVVGHLLAELLTRDGQETGADATGHDLPEGQHGHVAVVVDVGVVGERERLDVAAHDLVAGLHDRRDPQGLHTVIHARDDGQGDLLALRREAVGDVELHDLGAPTARQRRLVEVEARLAHSNRQQTG